MNRILRCSLLACLCLARTAFAQQTWMQVGSNATLTATAASYTNLAADAAGNYYVSYYGGGVTKGSVQRFDGTAWTYLGSQGITPSYATYNALAVNNASEVIYCFQDGGNSSRLSVMKYSPVTSAWTSLGTAISGGVINYQHLKINPTTQLPVISYTQGGIRVIVYNGTSWQQVGATETVASGTNAVHALAVRADTAFVAVQTGTAYTVYKTHLYHQDAWEPVGAAGFASGGSSNQFTASLAADAAGSLYLAFRGLSSISGKLVVYRYAGGQWTPLGTEGFSTGNVEHLSLTVSAGGVPCVAYRDNTVGRTEVQWYNGSGWQSLGMPSDNIGNWNSAVIDAAGNLVVAFANSTGTGGGLVTVRKYATSVAPALPVRLVYFTAALHDQAARLAWKTEQEAGGEVYSVERSLDGRSFSAVQQVPAQAATDREQRYAATDLPPAFPVYYRLCTISKDGQRQYSAAVLLQKAGNMAVRVSPNPVTDRLLVTIRQVRTDLDIILADGSGKQCRHTILKAGETVADLPVAGLAQGIYYLYIRGGGMEYPTTILKQ